MASALQGYFLGLTLILAIGAQNAFVLRQGLRRSHVLLVCLTCAISDSLLITAGVAGLGALVEANPELGTVMRWGGALFLIAYGARSLRAALIGGEVLEAGGEAVESARTVFLTCLALTWLNPHVYLDTVVLLGAVSTKAASSLLFGIGAVTASFTFFLSLGFGARLLAPFFAKPISWRILDGAMAFVMWALAAKLILA